MPTTVNSRARWSAALVVVAIAVSSTLLRMRKPQPVAAPAAVEVARRHPPTVHSGLICRRARRGARGVFQSDDPIPFVWTATAEQLLAKVQRARTKLNQLTSQM